MENYYNRSLPVPALGPIQLQTHGGEIRWRNVFIRELEADESNRWLRGLEEAGFEPLFNGKDLTGWAGAVADYEVKDGAIVCRAGRGGTLFTREQFGDFVVRLEFQLPSAANNGLAIRYPGTGDAAYEGMCELQILAEDYEAVKGRKLDRRQLHGSAYGLVAATPGYLRPAGTWNYQVITVKGSTIQVELNGTIILDADLDRVIEFMVDKPHPGKTRRAGHFGFAGHNDPVQFRDVAIRPLN